jgi:demethylmenaquinone methyltransferase/2-methoxy-6-polyprenyl-1,4-benzoquinol methylase
MPRTPPHATLTQYYPDEPGRRKFVSWLFDETAHHYDWIIRVMSFGSGTWYRGDALGRAGLGPGMRLLDVACGTGPVAEAALKIVGAEGRVVGLDPSAGMLRETRARLQVPLVQGTAEGLPIAAGSFDMVSMGYALRHVADLDATFAEYRRVLKPGGRVLILEWTRPRSRAGLAATRLYLKHLVPAIARLGTGDRDAQLLMRYFWDTIENCVPPETILAALARAGFAEVKRNAVFGIFSEYTGTA